VSHQDGQIRQQKHFSDAHISMGKLGVLHG
jgi:hypothetical protein